MPVLKKDLLYVLLGFQRSDGTFGPFIVRIPEEDDPHSLLYDYDLPNHIITILDWTKEVGNDKYMSHMQNDGDNKPDTILVNGMGRFKHFQDANGTTIFTPTARFTVEQVGVTAGRVTYE